jgi:hypothetical protein
VSHKRSSGRSASCVAPVAVVNDRRIPARNENNVGPAGERNHQLPIAAPSAQKWNIIHADGLVPSSVAAVGNQQKEREREADRAEEQVKKRVAEPLSDHKKI